LTASAYSQDEEDPEEPEQQQYQEPQQEPVQEQQQYEEQQQQYEEQQHQQYKNDPGPNNIQQPEPEVQNPNIPDPNYLQQQQPEVQHQNNPDPDHLLPPETESQHENDPSPGNLLNTDEEQQSSDPYETQELGNENEQNATIQYEEYIGEDVTTWETQQIEEVIPPEELKELITPDEEKLSEAIDDLSQKQLQILEELPVEKLVEILKIPESEALELQKEISANTPAIKQLYQFTEEISNEQILELYKLQDEQLPVAISKMPEEQVREFAELPADKLAVILKVPIAKAKDIQREILSNAVIPYDKSPLTAPETIASIPGVTETVDGLNYILTAGLDMTPLQRKRAQKVVIIVILCTLLPYLFTRKHHSNS